ncbi:hypothetical protein NPIL_53471 [Nephila pilipes]|uniref:Uncharacterized protein n=1 Tax=Nephila pilipes TaxID=299642 RepID=A0A8X6PAG5_NEPPI|nr:hypothetical protein NPIL_53471 [Nephila pilipes]
MIEQDDDARTTELTFIQMSHFTEVCYPLFFWKRCHSFTTEWGVIPSLVSGADYWEEKPEDHFIWLKGEHLTTPGQRTCLLSQRRKDGFLWVFLVIKTHNTTCGWRRILYCGYLGSIFLNLSLPESSCKNTKQVSDTPVDCGISRCVKFCCCAQDKRHSKSFTKDAVVFPLLVHLSLCLMFKLSYKRAWIARRSLCSSQWLLRRKMAVLDGYRAVV